jgi:MinD-like ATPase involved in chromosome partitioning or flagellar assembly
VDGTETGWGRPAEPAPRWRVLLDRARHGSRADETPGEDDQQRDERAPSERTQNGQAQNGQAQSGQAQSGQAQQPQIRQAPPSAVQPLPSRPVTALDRRPFNPLDQRSAPTSAESRPMNPLDRRPVNPLDRRGARNGSTPEPRPAAPPPVNPLEPRRQARISESFQGRADPEQQQPHSFFNPATRPVPPPAPPSIGYPPARAAASVGSAAVLPPPPPGPAVLSPTSPAAARIEWRQATPDEDLERAIALMRRKLGTPRVLAFANPKGGVHKTTATVLAAATIGSVRGRGVLAWDDNELRGTLGLRAGSARHARTIRHLLGDLLQIENMHGDDLLQELDGYLRHASDGSYDVLAGEENPRFAQRLDQSTVRRVMDLLRRTHDVICVDTGNNVESVNWQTVMRAADQLVITTVPREDAAFTADWMLDLLNDTGMEDLAANAVTLISCPSSGELPLLDDLTKHFKTRTRAVAVVPYDPALEVGSSIEYSELQPETRQAWLRAASTMIEPFAQ